MTQEDQGDWDFSPDFSYTLTYKGTKEKRLAGVIGNKEDLKKFLPGDDEDEEEDYSGYGQDEGEEEGESYEPDGDKGGLEDPNVLLDFSDKQAPKQDEELRGEDIWWTKDSLELPSLDIDKGKFYYDVNGRLQQRFSSVMQFVDFIYGPCVVKDGERLSHQALYAEHCFGVTWEQAHDLLMFGWPDGVEHVKKFTERLHSVLAGVMPKQEFKHEVTGQVIDVDRFIQGIPEDFMQLVDSDKSEKTKKPLVVRIVTTVDITMGPESFIMRGAAVTAVTQLLEKHGFRVQIDCHIGSNEVVDTFIRVKNAEDKVNIENLVMLTAHPVMFWRLAYGSWEQMAESDRRRAGWLGTKSRGWISEPVEDDRGDIYISARGSRWIRSEETAVKWILETLKEQGIEVGE